MLGPEALYSINRLCDFQYISEYSFVCKNNSIIALEIYYLSCAGTIVLELSKDKHNASLIDRQLSQFIASVNRVENELSSQIRYLTQVMNCYYVSV